MVLLVHMADRRRLQGEIDKTLKKINEGVEAFDDVWQRLLIVSRVQVQTATNANQKEKYENELKKEIKKLQRLREQIKTWQSSNDIKDKKPLLEARKNIEQQMEKFKEIERETKQKPYSKSALGSGSGAMGSSFHNDPLEKEREDIGQWIEQSNSKLNSQISDFEAKLEELNANKKKRIDKEKIESTKHRLDMHKKYMSKLRRIGNMVKKNLINVKKVNEIKDDVDFYIENNDQADFVDNMDEVFDELELDKYDSASSTSRNYLFF
jgi:CCR4-NOT transcription complex subunit 3